MPSAINLVKQTVLIPTTCSVHLKSILVFCWLGKISNKITNKLGKFAYFFLKIKSLITKAGKFLITKSGKFIKLK